MQFYKWLEQKHPESGFIGADKEGSAWKSRQYLASSKNSRSRRLNFKKRKEAESQRIER